MKIKSKFWIEVDGKPVFGRGRVMLLEGIESNGSISKAAREINISYRKAWGYLDAMEKRLQMQLVERHAGGKDGGGASLTAEARAFLNKFRKLEEGLNEIVDKRFLEVFEAKGG